MKNKLCKLFIVFFAFVILNSSTMLSAESVNLNAGIISEIDAKSFCVYESNTDNIVYQKEKDIQLPIASVTKIVTAIVTLNCCDNINEIITVSDEAVGIEGTSIYLKQNEQLSIKQLLLGLILASGNDCAVALAEHCGGLDNFVTQMNNYVNSLGLLNTHFDNPHGLDSPTHYSSAYDLCVIMSDGLKNNKFKEIIGIKTAIIPKTNKYQERYLKNKDKLLFIDDYCIGGKTGFTDNAGRCFINVNEKDNMQIISVVLNCPNMFNEVNDLNKKCFDEYQVLEFLKPYQFVDEIEVLNGNIPFVGLSIINGYTGLIKRSELENYQVKFNYPKSINAPVVDKQLIGSVEVLYNESVIFKTEVLAISSAENLDYKFMLDNIIKKWYVD